jgi:WhiB family transcriptional regulator, redox-sensing transcriptional regulator
LAGKPGRSGKARFNNVKFIYGESEWTTKAACKGADATLFYSGKENGQRGGDTEQTLPGRMLYCLPSEANNNQGCPVIEQCLRYALRNKEHYGIWGGMTSIERRRYARQQC